jgi:hypothetical protein
MVHLHRRPAAGATGEAPDPRVPLSLPVSMRLQSFGGGGGRQNSLHSSAVAGFGAFCPQMHWRGQWHPSAPPYDVRLVRPRITLMTRMRSPPSPHTFLRAHPRHPRFINFPFKVAAADCRLTRRSPGGAMRNGVRREVSATSSGRSVTFAGNLRRSPQERYHEMRDGPLVRLAPDRSRLRHPNAAGTPWPRRSDNDGLRQVLNRGEQGVRSLSDG